MTYIKPFVGRVTDEVKSLEFGLVKDVSGFALLPGSDVYIVLQGASLRYIADVGLEIETIAIENLLLLDIERKLCRFDASLVSAPARLVGFIVVLRHWWQKLGRGETMNGMTVLKHNKIVAYN